MKARTFACVALVALGSTSCSMPKVLHDQRVEGKAKEWTLVVTKVTDGPNGYTRGQGHDIDAADGYHFIWVYIALRNDASTRRSFNYDRCDLDLAADRVLPSFVDMDKFINILVEKESEELDPGEEITRKVVFSYPEGKLPTQFSCGEITIPLSGAKRG